jgi:acyl-CoA synthetase (NDP forming)
MSALEPPESPLSSLFDPTSIAVIGSLKEGWMGGYVVIKCLLNAGYRGRIYPVNPSCTEVLGLKSYHSLKETGVAIDLAVIMVNAQGVPDLLEQCGQMKIRSVIVVSDGFAERDEDGARLQEELVKIGKRFGIRIIGPNTVGVVNTGNGLNTCPYDPGYYTLKKGSISIFSQTGMTNPQGFPYRMMRFGIRKICDLGNKCDVDECDMLDYLEDDPETGVICMYLESLRDGRRFLKVAKRVSCSKPLLVLKSGKTVEGSQASASHTGSLAMDDRVFDDACRQAGIIRLEGFGDFFEVPKVFASQPLPKGNRMAVMTQSGAFGVLATDEAAKYGIGLASLTPQTARELEGIFRGLGKSPVDVGPATPAVKDFFSFYPRILSAVMKDENVDCVFNALWAGEIGNCLEAYIGAYEELRGRALKPLATWICGPNHDVSAELTTKLEDMGFPVFPTIETSIKAMAMALRYAKFRRKTNRPSVPQMV